jgi:hypothetical protein
VNLLVSSPGDEVDRAVRASVQALADVQKFVNQVTDQLWPGNRAKSSPNAAAANGELKLWFGDHAYPVLRLASIPYRRPGSLSA